MIAGLPLLPRRAFSREGKAQHLVGLPVPFVVEAQVLGDGAKHLPEWIDIVGGQSEEVMHPIACELSLWRPVTHDTLRPVLGPAKGSQGGAGRDDIQGCSLRDGSRT